MVSLPWVIHNFYDGHNHWFDIKIHGLLSSTLPPQAKFWPKYPFHCHSTQILAFVIELWIFVANILRFFLYPTTIIFNKKKNQVVYIECEEFIHLLQTISSNDFCRIGCVLISFGESIFYDPPLFLHGVNKIEHAYSYNIYDGG